MRTLTATLLAVALATLAVGCGGTSKTNTTPPADRMMADPAAAGGSTYGGEGAAPDDPCGGGAAKSDPCGGAE